MQNEAMGVFIYTSCLIAFIFFVRLFKRPLLFLLQFFVKAVFGIAIILLTNTYCGGMGLSVALNPVTVLLSAMLGIPGVGAMLMLTVL